MQVARAAADRENAPARQRNSSNAVFARSVTWVRLVMVRPPLVFDAPAGTAHRLPLSRGQSKNKPATSPFVIVVSHIVLDDCPAMGSGLSEDEMRIAADYSASQTAPRSHPFTHGTSCPSRHRRTTLRSISTRRGAPLGRAFRESKPKGLHLRFLAEQCLKLSLHTAPIRQTCR